MSHVRQRAWAAREVLSHIAYDVSDLQQRFSTATIAKLVRANSVVRTAKKLVQNKITQKFFPLDLNNVVFVSVTEASFAAQSNGDFQLGYATLVAERSILGGSARANLRPARGMFAFRTRRVKSSKSICLVNTHDIENDHVKTHNIA